MKRKVTYENYVEKTKKYKDVPKLINFLVMNAIISQDLSGVEKLLESDNLNQCKDFNIDFCNKEGNSLLHIAIESCFESETESQDRIAETIIKKLVGAGANNNLKNSRGETAHELLVKIFPNYDEESEFTRVFFEAIELYESSLEKNEHKIQINLTGAEQNDKDSSSNNFFDE